MRGRFSCRFSPKTRVYSSEATTAALPMPPLRLDSKRALVTGSAKGLGAAIKRSLATAGAKVLQTCRTLY